MQPADDQKKIQEELISSFNKAPIKHVFGMNLSYDSEGGARFDMPYNPNFDHGLGGIHGGVMATLLDNAGWFTAAVHYDTWISTVDFNMTLIEHAEKEDLFAVGKIISAKKRLAFAEMEVRTGSGRLIAKGRGTFKASSIKRKSLS